MGVASLMFLCNNKLYQGWAVLTTGITVSPYGFFSSEYRGHGMQDWGQIISLVAGTQLFAMSITIVSLLFLSAELLPWEMHTCVPDQNSEFSLILCFLNTSVIYYVAG